MNRYAILTLALLLIAGCVAGGGKTIRIEPPAQATQTITDALSGMLLQMGYRHLGLKDPLTGQYLQTVEQYGEYRMAFAAPGKAVAQVLVRVKENSAEVVLEFSEEDQAQLSKQAEALFRTLVDRMTLEFGQENVTVR